MDLFIRELRMFNHTRNEEKLNKFMEIMEGRLATEVSYETFGVVDFILIDLIHYYQPLRRPR